MSEQIRKTADRLIELCREGNGTQCLNELYAENARSVEAATNPETGESVTEGLEGILGKHAWWDANMEQHAQSIEGPFMHGDNRFGVIFEIDVTDKNSGQRMKMRELAIYECNADGKVVSEEFYYTM